MTVDDKLNQLMGDVTKIKTESMFHTEELRELKTKLDPVFDHVNGMKFLAKLAAGILGVGTLILGILSLILK